MTTCKFAALHRFRWQFFCQVDHSFIEKKTFENRIFLFRIFKVIEIQREQIWSELKKLVRQFNSDFLLA